MEKREIITEMVVEMFQLEDKEIGYDSCLVKDYGADSIDMLSLVALLEREFEIPIPTEKLKELTSIKTMEEFFCQHQAV